MNYFTNGQSFLPDTLFGAPRRQEKPLQEFWKILERIKRKGNQTIGGAINNIIDQLYADIETYDSQAARAKQLMRQQNAMDAANGRPLTY